MSCGLKILGEGAKGGKPLALTINSPNLPIPYLILL